MEFQFILCIIGDPLLAKVSATSSLLSAIIGSCAAVGENLFEAAVSALMINGVAAEIAANKTEGQGPGNFQIEFIDQLSLISSSEIRFVWFILTGCKYHNIIKIGCQRKGWLK